MNFILFYDRQGVIKEVSILISCREIIQVQVGNFECSVVQAHSCLTRLLDLKLKFVLNVETKSNGLHWQNILVRSLLPVFKGE